MKKIVSVALTIALMLCGLAALAEAPLNVADQQINTLIDDGGFVIQIDVGDDMLWEAFDMAQDDTVVYLYMSDVLEGTFVARYQPNGDGDVTVGVRHVYGMACDRVVTWDLHVEDGAVQEVTGGSEAVAPADEDLDPYFIGEWVQADTQFSVMTMEKNEGPGWNVEIVSPLSHGAYVFKATVWFDCELNSLVYNKGKFWDVPITDSEEAPELGEAKIAGTCGRFALEGDEQDLRLDWYDDSQPEAEMIFERAADDAGVSAQADEDFASELYTQEELAAAAEQISLKFASFEGCEMHALNYAGDECNSDENVAWLNGLAEGASFVQVAEFLSDFHTPADGSGALEPDTEYTDYQWWLGRAEAGDWQLVTWGY